MAIKLEVGWSNPAHPLLAGPAVAASPEYPPGSPAQPNPVVAKVKQGVFRIEIPGDPLGFELSVRFQVAMESATIPQRNWRGRPPRVVMSKTSAPAVMSRVALARQKYTVRNGQLLPVADTQRFGASAHPLFSPPGAARPGGFIPIRMLTDFVNVKDLWMNRATDSERYTKLHQPGTKLVPLGFTAAGGPPLWFAIVPDICRTASSISCLVFFRPTGHYKYTSIDQAHDMYPLNRYLISPQGAQAVRSGEAWAFDRFFPYFPANAPEGRPIWYRDLCVGMEAALANSKKNAVILIPWPSGDDFGIAPKADLTEVSRQVLRLLHSEGLVGEGRSQVSLNRLGVAGFSSGSGQMILALNRNGKKMRELYAFDCQRMRSFVPRVTDWGKEQENRLRMTGGYAETTAANVKIHDDLVNRHSKPTDRVTVVPRESATSWAASQNKWWDYVLWDGNLDLILWSQETNAKKEEEALRSSGDVRHQFAMFGGRDPSRKEGFFAEFLKNSDL
jgi:hypothetical protein